MTSKEICIPRATCRICGSARLEPVIDLGPQFIASAFVDDKVPVALNQMYPTEVVRCVDGCGLVQMRHSVDPALLYTEGYGYRSGTNEQMRTSLADIANSAEKMVALKSGDTILDIGCNDGTLLDSYRTKDLDKVGFDPVANLARSAEEKGVHVINDFFSGDPFHKARPGRMAKVITSIAMFYDLEQPVEFVRDVAGILDPNGVWVVELSYLPSMLEKTSFDTICHEHLEYYALRQLEWMAEKNDLSVRRVELNEVNGGSIRAFIQKKGNKWLESDRESVEALRRRENGMGLDTDLPYLAFREASKQVKEDLSHLLKKLKSEGKKVFAYGASTKGNTLLQYCGIDHRLLEKAADRNPGKWGRHTLGTNVPIVSEEQARNEKPDYFLVLPWHFFAGFVVREAEFLGRGGKFILPLPKVKVIGAEDL